MHWPFTEMFWFAVQKRNKHTMYIAPAFPETERVFSELYRGARVAEYESLCLIPLMVGASILRLSETNSIS